ncbi:MAG TPA: nucleotide-binding protein [Candidatus Kryptonia bacterium]
MTIIEEIKIHAEALQQAVNDDKKFFAAIIHYVDRLAQLAKANREDVSKDEFKMLADKIEDFFQRYRPTGESLYIPPNQTSNADPTVQDINRLVTKLISLDDDAFKALFPSPRFASQAKGPSVTSSSSPCVFIGHGRSKLWARVKVFLEDEVHIPAISYESESRVGESIVPILEKMLDQATFAVLILTAEDETPDGSKRARQNVVHEAGLFQGRLGFTKAVVLRQDGLEDFSNIAGLQYIGFSDDKIEQTFYELQRVLKREKMIS